MTGRFVLVALACGLACPAAYSSEIGWEGGVTVVYQDADDDRADGELTASADLFASLRQESGEWLLYVEASSSPSSDGVSAFYPTANGDAGSVLTSGGDGGLHGGPAPDVSGGVDQLP